MATKTKQRKDPYEEKAGRSGVVVWLVRLVFLFLAVTACLAAGVLLYNRWLGVQRGGAVAIEGGDPSLNPAERLYLETYLSARAEQLAAPAGSHTATLPFTISPGQSANIVARNLADAGAIANTDLFINYLRYYGLDSELEAGTYTLESGQTVPELAQVLTASTGRDIMLRFLEGWRLEEMVRYLAATTPAGIDAEQFLAIVQRRVPFDLSGYDFLHTHPAGTSLEGYLFPDTYRVPTDADAAYLVDLMLTNFGNRVTPTMRQAVGVNGLSLREAVTLASIVERETPVAEERPLVAAVFYNRLAQDMRLQADPTVQYVVGFYPAGDTWWKSPLSQADLELDSPYNTYLYPGLPPGPIANPGLASLQAVADPAGTDYLFFVADCNAAGRHLFSTTYEEHLLNVERCR